MNRQLGADLRYHRMRQVMSCEEVAEMVGTTPEQVLSWERSESVPDREALRKLGLLFGVSPADLLGEDDPPAADTAPSKDARGMGAESGFDKSGYQDSAQDAGARNAPSKDARGTGARSGGSQSDGARSDGARSDDSRSEPSWKQERQAAGIPPFPRGVAEAVFTPYLMPGESLLWYGQPDPSQVFQRNDIFLLPFGLFFFVFAVFWVAMASMAGGAFALFGLPFVGVGAYLLFGRLIHTKEVKKYTHYAITDRRVLLLYRGSRVAFRDIALSQLGQLSLESSTAGLGTVRIRGLETVVYQNHRAPYYQSAGQGFGSAALLSGLVHIPQAEQVFHLLRRLSPEVPPFTQP